MPVASASTIVLYPPIEDEDDSTESSANSSAIAAEQQAAAVQRRTDSNIDSTVPEESRKRSAETSPVTAVARRVSRRDNSTNDRKAIMPSQLDANFETLKRAKLLSRDATDGMEGYRGLAVETAQLANSEIDRMRRAVAELEALLEAKDGDVPVRRPAEPRFPSLPKVVMVVSNNRSFVDDEEEGTDNDDDNDDGGDDGSFEAVAQSGKLSSVMTGPSEEGKRN